MNEKTNPSGDPARKALADAREALARLAEPLRPPASVMSISRLRISIAIDALARLDAALSASPAPEAGLPTKD